MEEESLNLVIKTVNNDVYNISVTNSTSVYNLKDAIRQSTSIDIDRQRLIYRGKVLTDESVIRDYNIEDGHTVHMVARPANYREMQQTAASNSPAVPAPQQTPEQARIPRMVPIRLDREGGPEQATTAASLAALFGGSPVPPTAPEPNFENIRQSLLTMHTLFSTVNSVNHFYHSESRRDSNLDSKPSSIDTAVLPSDRRFFVGQWLDVKDTVNQWLEATVMNVDYGNKRIFVHYNGWPQRWDEWLNFDSPRIAPFRARTNHNNSSNSLCPSPNINAPHAPTTGINDIRTLLPELANVFRNLQPIVEELAYLSEESLKQNSVAYPPNNNSGQPGAPNIAQGMPWDNLISNSQGNQSQPILSESKQEFSSFPSSSSSLMCSDNGHDMKDERSFPADSKDSSSFPHRRRRSFDRHQTSEEIESRLQLLARDACPLFDRFGRLLSDVSPHLWNRAMPGINRPTPVSRFDPFQSLESRLLSLLRERPPSPPPLQSYRAPISSQNSRLEPMELLRNNIFSRGNPVAVVTNANIGNDSQARSVQSAAQPDMDINRLFQQASAAANANNNISSNSSLSSSSTTSAPPAANASNPAGRGRGLEHHVDIHIAIVSPQTARPNVESLSRTVANLTASLQAQAQQLAQRTQELSERTSAVSEITSAITQAIRNANQSAANQESTNQDSQESDDSPNLNNNELTFEMEESEEINDQEDDEPNEEEEYDEDVHDDIVQREDPFEDEHHYRSLYGGDPRFRHLRQIHYPRNHEEEQEEEEEEEEEEVLEVSEDIEEPEEDAEDEQDEQPPARIYSNHPSLAASFHSSHQSSSQHQQAMTQKERTRNQLLEDLAVVLAEENNNLHHSSLRHPQSLMPSESSQQEQLPYFQISNQNFTEEDQRNFQPSSVSSVNNRDIIEDNFNQEGERSSINTNEMISRSSSDNNNNNNNSDNNNPNSNFFQRLRRSFFSSRSP